MATKLQKSTARRDVSLSRLKEAYSIGSKAQSDESLIAVCKVYAKQIDNFYQEFNEHQNTLVSLIDDEEVFIALDKTRKEGDTYYFKAKAMFSTLDPPPEPINVQPPSSDCNLKLQKITIAPFTGNIKDWNVFIELFTSLVDKNLKFSNTEKLYYLTTLLRGEPLNLIKNLPLVGANYQVALDALKAQYSNRRQLATLYINEILKAAPLTRDSPEELRPLLNLFRENLAALKNEGFPTVQWDLLLLNLLLDKIHVKTRAAFESKYCDVEMPTYRQLFDYLQGQAHAAEIVNLSTQGLKGKTGGSHIKQVSVHQKTALVVNRENACHCPICSGDHSIYQCPVFLGKSVQERQFIVKQRNLCFNCLSSQHMKMRCQSRKRCNVCRSKHHTLLHLESSRVVTETATAPVVDNESSQTSSSQPTAQVLACPSAITNVNSTILLSTAEVEIKDAQGRFQIVRILFDSGSMANFMTQDCANRLGLKCRYADLPIEGLANASLAGKKGIVRVSMKPVNQDGPCFDLDAIILQNICSNQPHVDFNLTQLPHLQGITLADSKCLTPAPVDVLIGAELIPYLFLNNRIYGRRDQPVAISTIFGWVLQGKLVCSNSSPPLQSLHSSVDSLENCLKTFWKLEAISSAPVVSSDDKKCEEMFEKSTKRVDSGRFCVKLPFRQAQPQLGNSYNQALRRLYNLERRLDTKPDVKANYSNFMEDYLTSGHMSAVNKSDFQSPKAYYIPHHYVLKPESVSTRLRVVFDGSAKTSSGNSLNEELLVGPKLQKDIFSILMQFRKHPIGLICDVKQMYRQILVAEEDRDYQRILWRRSTNDPVQEFKLNTVTYGLSCSPFLALRTLQKLADIGQTQFPLASEVVKSSIYIDDVVVSATCLASALALKDELITLFDTAGFQLRKWATNCKELLSNDDPQSSLPISFDKEEPSFVKVLGLYWDPTNDFFSYSVNPTNQPCTKRSILADVARIYDPLGLITPVVLVAKHLIQKLWLTKCDWDQTPPPEICEMWTHFKLDLRNLSSLNVPRCLLPEEGVKVQLHGFCDASEVGYSAAVYFRFETTSGKCTALLCCAKSRVAPVRTVSIPRLELLGAVLLVDLMSKILELSVYNFEEIITWTDSEIVLTWLNSHPSRWKTFVANRTAHIQATLPDTQWRWTPTADNPADCGSRGIYASQLLDHHLWWNGPTWLSEGQNDWPDQPTCVIDDRSTLVEEKISANLVVEGEVHLLDDLLQRFSSLLKIQRILAYILRFGSPDVRSYHSRPLIPIRSELQAAMIVLCRYVQSTIFESTITALKKGRSIPKPLRRLAPFLDDQGCLRVGGRLTQSQLSFDAKHPLLLPSRHPLTDRIVAHVHQANLHPGHKTLAYLLLQQFWILAPRRAIQHCISKCIRCFKGNPKGPFPPMASLPPYRVSQVRAFQEVCLDYAGPFFVTPLKRRGIHSQKAYIAVFVCCAVKAVHLELVSSLTSESFLAAFQRFISRRGPCISVHSDQGTNFIGANTLLHRLAEEAGTKLNIRWHFNPPSAPHFNGLAEAGVKSVKTHLTRVVGEQVLTYEEFYTLLTKIEALLNSRPLCPISSDPNDVQPLTPGHFLTLEPLNNDYPEPNPSQIPATRLTRWQLLQAMHKNFWDRWSKEYLHSLQQRAKWHQPSRCIQVDTLVLVKHDNKPPNQWDLARIVKVHPGPDGIVRVVTLKGVTGQYQRPVVKLCPLPVH